MKTNAWIGRGLLFLLGCAAFGYLISSRGYLPLVAATAATTLLLAVRYPRAVVLAVLLSLPLQYLIFPLLLQLGAPAGVVRQMGFLKEWGVAALLLTVLHSGRRPARASLADLCLVGFVAIGALYLVLPELRPGLVDTLPFNARSIAFRTACLGPLFFLAARRLNLDVAFYRRVSNVIISVGVVLAIGAVVEEAAPDVWTQFLVNVLNTPRYRQEVFGLGTMASAGAAGNAAEILTYADFGGLHVLRPGSLFLNPLALASYLLIPFGLALARALGHRDRRAGVAALAISVGILISLTRSAVLAAGLVLLILLARRNASGLARAATAISLVAAFALAPGSATLATRSFGDQADSASTQGHIEAAQQGVELVGSRPLGLGLGVQPGRAQVFAQPGDTTNVETSYLQTAVELGVIPMLLFLIAVIAVWRSLGAASQRVPACDEARWAIFGVAVMALFLPVWFDLATSVTVWMVAGLALGAAERGDRREQPHEHPLEAAGRQR